MSTNNILAIETSCDETAISIIATHDDSFEVLAHVVHSQIDIHREYGGVFPTLAKREHGINLPPVLVEALRKAKLYATQAPQEIPVDILTFFEKNPELEESFKKIIPQIEKPEIDYIAVTEGPGLEPALWAGISFAEALGKLWSIPVVPVNHMEGHIASVLTESQVEFPALAFLVSGGHTELVYTKKWGSYNILGHTLDDAIGEAFDKVARLLGLPYPGGPEISKLAAKHREQHAESNTFSLPRPMEHSGDLNFSFSGLKTAVRYALKDKEMAPDIQQTMAREFEDAVIDVCVTKLRKALSEHSVNSCILAGGVSANARLREKLKTLIDQEFPGTHYMLPEQYLSTDNATMIALAAWRMITGDALPHRQIRAQGNLKLAE